MQSDHPYKLLQDAVEMYSPRVAVAIEQRAKHKRPVGMFVVMGDATRVVPDMKVLCLDRDQLMQRLDMSHPSAEGAVAMLGRDEEGQVAFGVLLSDGGAMATTLQVHERGG